MSGLTEIPNMFIESMEFFKKNIYVLMFVFALSGISSLFVIRELNSLSEVKE